jgi:hypothetical protein
MRRMAILDLAPFAFTVRALRARTVNAGFGGASRRRNQLVENAGSVRCMKRGTRYPHLAPNVVAPIASKPIPTNR